MTATQGQTPLSAPSDFIVLNASAGSGKTYSLVQHILMNALRKKDMDHAYQKVLASHHLHQQCSSRNEGTLVGPIINLQNPE